MQSRLSRLQASIVFTVLLILPVLFGSCVQAGSWNAIASGYAVTTDWHGVDAPTGTPIIATAGTTNETVGLYGYVVFLWHFEPNDTVFFTSLATPLEANGTTYWDKDKKENLTVYYADDLQVLTIEGEWGVQALFYDTEGKLMGDSGIIKIRATSIVVVPEVLSALIITLAASGLFTVLLKVRTSQQQKRKGKVIFCG